MREREGRGETEEEKRDIETLRRTNIQKQTEKDSEREREMRMTK